MSEEQGRTPYEEYICEGVQPRTGLTFTEYLGLGVFGREDFLKLINQRTMKCPSCIGTGSAMIGNGSIRSLGICKTCDGCKEVQTPWYRPWGPKSIAEMRRE